MVPDGYDAIVPVVPYLNWSSYNRSMLILQLSIVTTVVMLFLGPLLPLRMILLIGGEAMFIATHPWVPPVVEAIGKMRAARAPGSSVQAEQLQSVMRKRGKEASHVLRSWLELDRLDDSIWLNGWRDVEIFENERLLDVEAARQSSVGQPRISPGPGWSAGNLRREGDRKPWTKGSDGWSPEDSLQGTGYTFDHRCVSGTDSEFYKTLC